jgi:hypothetical protein
MSTRQLTISPVTTESFPAALANIFSIACTMLLRKQKKY